MTVSPRTGRAAAIAATAGFGGLAAFQLALALGAPLGDAAWGGTSSALSTAERVGSAVSVLVYIAAAWLVLTRAGILPTSTRRHLLTRATRALAALFLLSALPNFASQSAWENFLLGPVAAALATLCVLVASAAPADAPRAARAARRPPRSAAVR